MQPDGVRPRGLTASPGPDPRGRRGRNGERLAAWALRLRGYRVLARRVRTPAAEVDLLCRRGDVLVLVEVKRRRRGSRGSAVEALRPPQVARLLRAAAWLEPRHPWAATVRVVLVAVDGLRLRVVPGPGLDG